MSCSYFLCNYFSLHPFYFFSLPFCARPSRFCYTESAWRSRTCEHGQGRVKHCRPVLGKSAAYPTNMNAVLKKYIFNAQCKRGFLKIKARVPVIVKVTIIASTLLLRRSMREGHFSIQTHSLPGASSAAQCASWCTLSKQNTQWLFKREGHMCGEIKFNEEQGVDIEACIEQ